MSTTKKTATLAATLLIGIACLMLAGGPVAWAGEPTGNAFPLTTSYDDHDNDYDYDDDYDDAVPEVTWAPGRTLTSDELEDLLDDYYVDVYSSDDDIVQVVDGYYYYDDQTVKALRPGTATLYDSYDDTPVLRVTVKAATLKRTGSSTVKVPLGNSKKLTYRSSIAGASITWKSSKPAVATVGSKGKVTAKSAGKTTISATSLYGNTIKWTVKVGKVKASKVKVAKISDQTYSGKAKKPALTLKYNGKKLKKGRDYTVTYENNKSIGTAKATIKFRGSYTGSVTKTFRIVAPKVGKPRITYWFNGSWYAKIEWDSGSNSSGTELWIEGGGVSTYDKYIAGSWGYGYCNRAVKDSTVWFYIRSYKKVGGMYFYSDWVCKTL